MSASIFMSRRLISACQLFSMSAFLFCAAQAQNTNAPGQVKKTDPAQAAAAAAAVSNGMTEAKALAKTKNLTSVEAKLAAISHAKPNTAAWHIELSHRLIQVADQLARDGDTSSVVALANSAIQHLTQADTLTSDVRTRSAAKAQIGFIQERFLGNSAGAIASYQAAAQLAPKSTAAKEAADRLKRKDDMLKGRVSSGSAQ